MGEVLRNVVVASVAVLMCVACVDLPDVEANECGNLVLDRDEDCDGTSVRFGEDTACGEPDTTNACFYVCGPANNLSCPQGWSCGSDQRCRRHSGEFEAAATSPYRFDVADFAIGDVDGDGNLDLLGQDLGDLRVRFGSSNGEFLTEYVTASGIARGPVAFGKFTDDDRTDVVLPLAEGISVFLGTADDTLEPVLYAPFSLDEVFGPEDVLLILPLESIPEPISPTTELLLLVDGFDDNGVYEGSLMVFFSDDGGGAGLPNNHRVSELVGRVPVANVDGDPLSRNEYALAFSGSPSVWVYTTTGGYGAQQLTPVLMQEIPLGTAQVKEGAHFGDFDGDGLLDVIISVSDGGIHKVMVARNLGGGAFAGAGIQPIFNRGFGSPFPLAVGQLDGDAHADYVYNEGIYLGGRLDGQLGTPNVLLLVAQAQAVPWNEAVFADFNGDGKLDVAVSFYDEDGVDLYLNSDTLYPNRFRVGTTDQARKLRVGDFDGDTIDDIAFLQRGQGQVGDSVYVVFGGTDGPSTAAIFMGRLGGVESFEPMIGQSIFIDGITDLFVVSRTGPQQRSRSIALLQGSSAQHLTSPFTLISSVKNSEADIPLQVLIGNFNNDNVRDIVAIADIQSTGIAATTRKFRLWALPGSTGDGGIKTDKVSSLEIDGVDFVAECAVWTSGDLDGDGIDEIIAIDGNAQCANRDFDRAPRLLIGKNPGGNNGVFDKTIVDIPGNLRGADELTMLDLDNDGDLDLLIRFAGDPTTINILSFTIDKGGLMVVWNRGGVLDVADPSTVEVSGGPVLLGATAVKLSTALELTLIAVTIDGLYVSSLDPASETYGAPSKSSLGGGTGRVQVGDLNKDGLDDLVYVVNRDVVVMLGKPAPPLGSEQ